MVDCKICEHPYCEHAGKQRGIVLDCANYMPRSKPQTNADRIRAMSDEELADHNIHTVKVWNRYVGYHEIEYRCSDGYTIGDYQMALRHELDWLKQPVKDGEDDG